MRQYYELRLNCARSSGCNSISDDYGFIEIFPQKSIIVKKGFFGNKEVTTIEYSGEYNVIAELVGDHFEDIILGKKIYFDPTGVKNIKNASDEELKSQLNTGLTCFSFFKVDSKVAEHYMKTINYDLNIVHKYIDEIVRIENKDNVKEELKSRKTKENLYPASMSSKPIGKKMVRSIKSA